MNTTDYYELRQKLGLTQSQMAEWLGLNGANRSHVVWEIETGRREPTGPIRILYALYAAGIDPEYLGVIKLESA